MRDLRRALSAAGALAAELADAVRVLRDTFDIDEQEYLSSGEYTKELLAAAAGAGPRFCPGALLGTVQLVTFAALMARDYVLDLPRLDQVEPRPDALLTPAGLTGAWRRR